MNKSFIAIFMGSDSDLSVMETTFTELKSLGIPFEVRILSAHHTPEATREFVETAKKLGCTVCIAASGLAAHPAGTVATHTIKPVIGIPHMAAVSLGGLDAPLSIVQMSGGIPVACTTFGKAEAKNTALLAAKIMAIRDPALAEKLGEDRTMAQANLKTADEKLQTAL